MKIIKDHEAHADSWSYKDGDFAYGHDTTTLNYQFRDENRSIVDISLLSGAEHGWATSASAYYYLVIEGTVEFTIRNGSREEIFDVTGSAFSIPPNTTHNYRAIPSPDLSPARLILFMNHLWDESEE